MAHKRREHDYDFQVPGRSSTATWRTRWPTMRTRSSIRRGGARCCASALYGTIDMRRAGGARRWRASSRSGWVWCLFGLGSCSDGDSLRLRFRRVGWRSFWRRRFRMRRRGSCGWRRCCMFLRLCSLLSSRRCRFCAGWSTRMLLSVGPSRIQMSCARTPFRQSF